MYKVSSSQFNYQYGDQIHFPYSIARLVAYIKTKKNLEENFQFEKTFVFREKIDDYVKRCKDSDILLCSCYVWNWEITTFLAKEVKKHDLVLITDYGHGLISESAAREISKLSPYTALNVQMNAANSGNHSFTKYKKADCIIINEGEIV